MIKSIKIIILLSLICISYFICENYIEEPSSVTNIKSILSFIPRTPKNDKICGNSENTYFMHDKDTLLFDSLDFFNEDSELVFYNFQNHDYLLDEEKLKKLINHKKIKHIYLYSGEHVDRGNKSRIYTDFNDIDNIDIHHKFSGKVFSIQSNFINTLDELYSNNFSLINDKLSLIDFSIEVDKTQTNNTISDIRQELFTTINLENKLYNLFYGDLHILINENILDSSMLAIKKYETNKMTLTNKTNILINQKQLPNVSSIRLLAKLNYDNNVSFLFPKYPRNYLSNSQLYNNFKIDKTK